ncbi:Fc.00g073200.m01.CDS01 [Cosmosporella sp. VM-42]
MSQSRPEGTKESPAVSYFGNYEDLPLLTAHIECEGGTRAKSHCDHREMFTAVSVDKIITKQPLQFQGRTDWEDIARPILPHYEMTEAAFKADIERVPSRPPFRDNDSKTYNGVRWAQHAWDLWELFKDMQDRKWASSFGLQSLIGIISGL